MNLLLIFLTGLTTGGLACVALQGGLLTSMIANQAAGSQTKRKKMITLAGVEFASDDLLSIAMFLTAKLLSHAVLGLFLGLLGSAITLSLNIRLMFQVFTALFMLGTAMNLLQVHPIFRFLSFQPPKFISRYIRNTSKSQAIFAPGLLGFLTIFIPCGVTQAMEVLAVNTASPIQGALIMSAFVLGTFPLFSIIGFVLTKLSESWHSIFNKVAAISLVALALYSFNGVAIVLDSPFSFQNLTQGIRTQLPNSNGADSTIAQANSGTQAVKINIFNSGYSPNDVTVKQNIPVELTLESKDAYSCALSFILNEFGISAFLKPTDRQVFTFTPTKKGNFTFACSMGMYTGTFRVI
ncbi:sulfite exporter TauE/SafE family protein [Candidatus Woesebacteria bacterium]|nr:sulfite exporter TauE/SafE family protein [Candidatus Woesebacteria bacterium]